MVDRLVHHAEVDQPEGRHLPAEGPRPGEDDDPRGEPTCLRGMTHQAGDGLGFHLAEVPTPARSRRAVQLGVGRLVAQCPDLFVRSP